MNSQLTHLVVQQRHLELVRRAEEARLPNQARTAVSAPSRRWNLGRLVATRRPRAAGLAAAAQPATPGPPQECLSCNA
jgi:hypothetical protein